MNFPPKYKEIKMESLLINYESFMTNKIKYPNYDPLVIFQSMISWKLIPTHISNKKGNFSCWIKYEFVQKNNILKLSGLWQSSKFAQRSIYDFPVNSTTNISFPKKINGISLNQ